MLKNIPHKELVERLKTIKEVLAENESAVTPELLEAIDMVIEMMKIHTPNIEQVLGKNWIRLKIKLR